MDRLEKLFRKISIKEKNLLDYLIQQLLSEEKGLNIKKLEKSDFYRCRKGRFRIIFHYERGDIIIDSIRLRNEDTYKDF